MADYVTVTGSMDGGEPEKLRKRVADANTASDPTQASVTEIVTRLAQHDAIGRNMALGRPCTFDFATC